MSVAFERRLFARLGALMFTLALVLPGAWVSYLQGLGPLDLSPMLALIVLQVVERILISVLDGFRPAG